MARALPAAGLDAAHRDAQLGAGGDQHRDVEGAVLLGAEHLLALVEEDGAAGRVLDQQVVDRRSASELADAKAVGDGLGEGEVVLARLGPEEREDGERAGDVGLADAKRLGEQAREGRILGGWVGLCFVHVFLGRDRAATF